ncbi:MAG: hypothetical protein WAV28_03945 [Sedimentisphaerales bacterium]
MKRNRGQRTEYRKDKNREYGILNKEYRIQEQIPRLRCTFDFSTKLSAGKFRVNYKVYLE